MKKYLNIISIIIGCIVLALFFIGVSKSSELLKQIAFWIVIVWGILRLILHSAMTRRKIITNERKCI